MAIPLTDIQILFTNYDIITYFLNLASCSEHFIIKTNLIFVSFSCRIRQCFCLCHVLFLQQTISHMRKRFAEWVHCEGRFLMTLMYEISDIRYLASCLKAYRLSEWIFFILKDANVRCFILIAVEIFHNIIRTSYP
jgi:hypothetical protein